VSKGKRKYKTQMKKARKKKKEKEEKRKSKDIEITYRRGSVASNFDPKSSIFHYVLIKEERMASYRLRRNGILYEPCRISGCYLLSREKHWKARKIKKVGEDLERSWTR